MGLARSNSARTLSQPVAIPCRKKVTKCHHLSSDFLLPLLLFHPTKRRQPQNWHLAIEATKSPLTAGNCFAVPFCCSEKWRQALSPVRLNLKPSIAARAAPIRPRSLPHGLRNTNRLNRPSGLWREFMLPGNGSETRGRMQT